MEKANGKSKPDELEWHELESDQKQREHVWRVLRERVLEWGVVPSGSGYFTRANKIVASHELQPFDRDADAFVVFQHWPEAVQIYKLSEAGRDYLVQIHATAGPQHRIVGVRAPTVHQSLFRGVVECLKRKRIKWRVGK